jgi:hypothetical protein
LGVVKFALPVIAVLIVFAWSIFCPGVIHGV